MQLQSHLLTSTDGAQSQLLLSRAASSEVIEPATPVILCLPAMGVPARKYRLLIDEIHEIGLLGGVVEHRGLDTSSLRASKNCDFGYYETLFLDIPQAINKIRDSYPENPIFLLGHSLGGQLATLYMSINQKQISGFIGIGTGTPFYKAWKFPLNFGLLTASWLFPFLAKIKGYFPGRELGFAGRESYQVMKDWSVSVLTGNYRIKGTHIDFENATAQVHKSVLMMTIDEDWLAPPESSKNLSRKLRNCEITHHHFTDRDFTNHSLGHFAWMKEPKPIVLKIATWLKPEILPE